MKFLKTFLPIALLMSLAASSELQNAVQNGNAERLHALLAEGADVNARDGHGRTPLVNSVMYQQKECFDIILNHENVAVNESSNSYHTALHFAAWNGNGYMCAALLEKGANVNAKDIFKKTPLMGSIEYREKESFDIILKQEDIAVNAADDLGNTALHFAARMENQYMCHALLEKGADVNGTWKKTTPLMEAISHGRNACAKILLRKDAKLKIKNGEGDTAIDIARQERNHEMVEILEDIRFFNRKPFVQIYDYIAGKGKKRKAAVLKNIEI